MVFVWLACRGGHSSALRMPTVWPGIDPLSGCRVNPTRVGRNLCWCEASWRLGVGRLAETKCQPEHASRKTRNNDTTQHDSPHPTLRTTPRRNLSRKWGCRARCREAFSKGGFKFERKHHPTTLERMVRWQEIAYD